MPSPLENAVAPVEVAIMKAAAGGSRPLLVALDGGSGAGKSTVAGLLAQRLPATVVPLDDFFAIDIPDHGWDALSISERLARVFDWDRVRQRALLPLLAGEAATWRPIDFESGIGSDGTYRLRSNPERRDPARIVILDGAYSAGPELSDLIRLAVLVQVPVAERHARLAAREPPEFLARWHALWDQVEAYYFRHVRPPQCFDQVLDLFGMGTRGSDRIN